jgi:SAM-dependent methyltransferase
MDPRAMQPLGEALVAFQEGEELAELIVRRDDGFATPLPLRHFFREPAAFSPLEIEALARCAGRVLDVGAGSGLHSIALQQRGLAVTAIDILPRAVQVMARRGVADARCADFFTFSDDPFDTILLLGHGVGMVGDLDGLQRFLAHAGTLLTDDGQMLLDSLDVRITDDPRHLAYHEANRRAGRFIGETRLQLEHAGRAGAWCAWLHIDEHTLNDVAVGAGWLCETLLSDARGEYVARLSRSGAAASSSAP